MPQVIPFGDRILVKRKKVGQKIGESGILIAADETAERPTDLATVVHVPDHSFADEELIGNAEEIIRGQTQKAKDGDSQSLLALLQFKTYLNIKSIKVGDDVMIGKYVGTTFHDNKGGGNLTLVDGHDIIGRVIYD